MNKQTKIIVTLLAFIILLIGASLLYQKLSSDYSPPGQSLENENTPNLDLTQDNSQTPDENTDGNSALPTEKPKILAPDFTVTDKDGNKVSLSDYIGKPIVLNFWASWCGPCKSEMPDFNKVSEEMGEDVLFLMVDLVDGQRETTKKGKAYIEEQGFTFTVLYDEDQNAAGTYPVYSIPTTFFIDSEGYIEVGYRGVVPEKALRKEIKNLLEKE